MDFSILPMPWKMFSVNIVSDCHHISFQMMTIRHPFSYFHLFLPNDFEELEEKPEELEVKPE